MIFIDYNGAVLALLLAQPNWEKEVKVELSVPWSEITEARSGAEARQPFGESARYAIEYTVDTGDAKESTDLKMWLMRLRDEMVAVPMWADYVEAQNGFNAGATSIPLAYGPPVNHGNLWIILPPPGSGPDGGAFEIVTRLSVTAGNITLASGCTLNWPAGTRLFPLLFGVIKNEDRPKFKRDTDELINGRIRVTESSPWNRRLSPFDPGGNQICGSGVPNFITTPLFHIRPDHTEPMETVDVDLLLAELGFGRELMRYSGDYPAVRGLEHTFLQMSRAEIAALNWFYVQRQGPTLRFMMLTFMGDLRLTQDLPLGDPKLVTIEASRYTDQDYSTNPGAPFLALNDREHITAIQVETIDGAGLHLVANLAQSYRHAETKLSFLHLSRFAETRLTWLYGTDGLATAKVRTLEVPHEYNDPPAEKSRRAYYFRFTEHVDVPVVLGYYTSYEKALEAFGSTWQPAPFALLGNTETLDLGDKLSFATFDFGSIEGVIAENPLRKMLEGTLEGRLECEVFFANPDAWDDGTAGHITSGVIVDPDFTGKEWTAVIDPFALYFRDDLPRVKRRKVCNVRLFSTWCARGRPTMREDFKSVATLQVVADPATTIQLAPIVGQPDPTLKPEDYFASQGWLEAGTGATFESRSIHHSEAIPGGFGLLLLTIDRPLRKTAIGAQIRFWPGCNGAMETCDGTFGNHANHMGDPHAPAHNPSADIPEVQQGAGGKKG